MFGDMDLAEIAFVWGDIFQAVIAICGLAIEEENDICVLFDATRVTKVRELRNGRFIMFNRARELGESDDGDIEFTSQIL